MAELPLERLLSMSVLEAARALKSFRKSQPGLNDTELVETLRAVRADLFALDYQAGLSLEAALGNLDDEAPVSFFRRCIDAIIASKAPFWVRLAPGGREQVMRAVELNCAQCFRAAGLLENPPSEDVRKWWDDLANSVRAYRNADRLAQGREAELLSYEREVALLASLGIAKSPVWAAIDDNSLGYDILSFRNDGDSEVNRLIEVKSSTSKPPRMILTRNEWRTAVQFGDALEFHLWTLPSKELSIISVAEMESHIAVNRGNGEWLQVEVIWEPGA